MGKMSVVLSVEMEEGKGLQIGKLPKLSSGRERERLCHQCFTFVITAAIGSTYIAIHSAVKRKLPFELTTT
jgi:hypothetical protein